MSNFKYLNPFFLAGNVVAVVKKASDNIKKDFQQGVIEGIMPSEPKKKTKKITIDDDALEQIINTVMEKKEGKK